MAGVKIADSVDGLKEGREIKMDEYFTKKYELVQAVHQERGDGMEPVIIRQRSEPKSDSSPDISRLQIEDDY